MEDAVDRARAIEDITRLLLSYPEAVDKGDFAGVGQLFDGVRLGDEDPMSAQQFEELWRKTVLTYEGGSPFTKHVVTNTLLEAGTDPGSVVSTSYFQVLRSWGVANWGRYVDRMAQEGDRWRIAHRSVFVDGNIPRPEAPPA